ncbi:MAG: LLM class flavin-dependent oxidoreductase [Chloroflexi bacterium]|nr:LLM class flavin-dependent oxidoreductase [Chloroflexota bacterium]
MVDFGLGLLHGPPKGQNDLFLADLDKTLSQIKGSFRSIWMTDHFQWEGQPTFEAWTVMSYLLARYPEFEVGPMVLGQNYRNPALLALMAATLQALSGGRFIMGIGAGWKEDEYLAYDYEYPSPRVRLQQLEETLIILKKMWEEPGQVSFEGAHYRIRDAWCEPKPEAKIPILVGGGGYTTMKHAAKYADMWNLPDKPLGPYIERLNIMRRHLDEIGRDPATLRFSWFGRVSLGRTEAEAEARGKSRIPHWTQENSFVGAPQRVAELMSEFVEAGVDYFMIDIIDAPDEEIVGMFTEEVIPAINGA